MIKSLGQSLRYYCDYHAITHQVFSTIIIGIKRQLVRATNLSKYLNGHNIVSWSSVRQNVVHLIAGRIPRWEQGSCATKGEAVEVTTVRADTVKKFEVD